MTWRRRLGRLRLCDENFGLEFEDGGAIRRLRLLAAGRDVSRSAEIAMAVAFGFKRALSDGFARRVRAGDSRPFDLDHESLFPPPGVTG